MPEGLDGALVAMLDERDPAALSALLILASPVGATEMPCISATIRSAFLLPLNRRYSILGHVLKRRPP